MDLDALRTSPCGQLVPISGSSPRTGQPWSYFAYVPDPLPSEPKLGLKAINSATKAAMAVARLDQAMSQIPNPGLLVRPAIRREAVSTSALEGTYATFDEVLEADFLEERQLSNDQREVRNYVVATERAMELLKTYPISRNMLGELQSIIVRGTPDDSADAGDLRKHQVAIGSKDLDIEDARFVPAPPGGILEEGFSDWEKWINSSDEIPVVAKMALGHYQFETLHPYNNGNGRLGRLVSILQLVEYNVLKYPVVNISTFLERRKEVYKDHLLAVSRTGNFDDWVVFYAEAVETQARDAMATIFELIKFKDETVQSLKKAGLRGSALDLVELLLAYPVIDVSTAARLLHKTFETANQAVSKLVEHGVLRELTGRQTNRLFFCREVYRRVVT